MKLCNTAEYFNESVFIHFFEPLAEKKKLKMTIKNAQSYYTTFR